MDNDQKKILLGGIMILFSLSIMRKCTDYLDERFSYNADHTEVCLLKSKTNNSYKLINNSCVSEDLEKYTHQIYRDLDEDPKTIEELVELTETNGKTIKRVYLKPGFKSEWNSSGNLTPVIKMTPSMMKKINKEYAEIIRFYTPKPIMHPGHKDYKIY